MQNSMKKIIILFVNLFLALFIINGQNDLFEKKVFQYKGETMPYRILFPENYNENESYPLVIFLHGSGERGDDNESQLKHGSALFTDAENRKNNPAIVLFPQCPKDGFWAPIKISKNGLSYEESSKPTDAMQLLIRLIKEIKKTEAVDKNRMYVLGLSMGGMGTFDLICRYPKRFAAAITICGGVNTNRLKKLAKMPIRIYHGDADPIVSQQHSRDAYIELKANGSQNAELFIFPGVQHNSWDMAFEQPDFLSWLFSKKKH
jgi:predicted peptidase